MSQHGELLAADDALRELQHEADFAHARHGRLYADALRHYHDQLAALLTQAFDEQARSNDLTLPKRDRLGLQRHAAEIARVIVTDVERVREEYRRLSSRAVPSDSSGRALVDAVVVSSRMQVSAWWNGHAHLATPAATAVAAQKWESFRPVPRWVPYAAGAGVVAAGAFPIASIFLL
ncbi:MULTISPECIES: hypothetical protein [Microbacterium]|uniref:hypothetical protein n=1 Tax=Microbacterium TaxID=33882 RepID=UPI001E28B7F9|nr:hypothetical protein [Microbacterium nymphoidis]MCD2497473.1 hypothetical protein [Microbacterium nymphoidis]